MTRNLIEVPLDRVLDHPLNSHMVTKRDRDKITNNIRRTRRYPPLVVRELTPDSEHYPGEDGYYQILDGHQRRLIFVDLVEEGLDQFSVVLCDDWSPITDEESLIALATLNSWGDNAPRARAELLHQITRFTDLRDAAQILPESERQLQDAAKLLKRPVADIKRLIDEVNKPDTVTMTFVVAHDQAALAKFTAAAQIFAMFYGATLTNLQTEEGGKQGRTAVLTFEVQNAANDIVQQALKKAGGGLTPGQKNKRGRALVAMATDYLAMQLTEETGVPLRETKPDLQADRPKAKRKRLAPEAQTATPAVAAS